MNRWHQIHRMRGAAFLILIGVLALLSQWHILRWGQSWPLFLILAGVMALAERAAWTADVREQQAAQGLGPMGQAGGKPAPPNPTEPPYWSVAPPSNTGETPFIQTHPPAPENPGREER